MINCCIVKSQYESEVMPLAVRDYKSQLLFFNYVDVLLL